MWAIILFFILSYRILSFLILSYLILYFGYSNIIVFIPLSPRNLQTSLTLCSLRLAANPCDTNIIFYHPLFFLLYLLHPVTTSLLSLPSFLPSLPAFITFTSSLSLHSFLPFHSSLPFLPFLSPTILFLLPSLPPYLSLSFRPFLHLPLILYSADPGSHQNVFTMRLVEEFSMSAKYAKILDLPDFPR